MTDKAKVREINDRLGKIAPYPAGHDQATATAVARYLAARAHVTGAMGLIPFGPEPNIGILARMVAEFAASHALFVLAKVDPEVAGITAREIYDAWEDGAGVGEWLWQHLGDATSRQLSDIAEELAAAMAAPDAEAQVSDERAAPRREAPPPGEEYRPGIDDLLIIVRTLMSRLVEAMGPSGADQCAYRRSAAARLPLTITAEDHGDHGTALRVRLLTAAGEAPGA